MTLLLWLINMIKLTRNYRLLLRIISFVRSCTWITNFLQPRCLITRLKFRKSTNAEFELHVGLPSAQKINNVDIFSFEGQIPGGGDNIV